jgi:hypothetical protein
MGEGKSGAKMGTMAGAIAAKLKTIVVANLPILQFSRSVFQIQSVSFFI